jgi:hypothetical protein
MNESPECPECYGKADIKGKSNACEFCEYLQSCEYFISTKNSVSGHTSGHASYEKISFSEKVSASPEISVDIDIADDSALRIMEFLLDVDNYTAELVSAVLHGNCNTTSDLGEKFGVSRQAIHRKIVDCCTQHPELRKLFYTRLYNCRRILTDSARLTKQKEKAAKKNGCNENQMEFSF